MEKPLPAINQRIRFLINSKFEGKILRFSKKLGLNDSQKIDRLFKLDIRNNEYPTPSTEIVLLISNMLEVSTDWLLLGKGEMKPNPDIKINEMVGDPETLYIKHKVESKYEGSEIIKELVTIIKNQRDDVRYSLETQRELVLRLPFFNETGMLLTKNA